MARAGLALLLCLSATAAAAGPELAANDPGDRMAQELLQRMLQAQNSLALAGEQVTTVQRQGRVVSSEQRVLRDGARAERLDYVRPPRLAGEQIVDNGRMFWHYFPANNTLQVGPSRAGRLRARIQHVMDRVKKGALRVQWLGQETVAGRNCGIVQVTPGGPSPAPFRRFWIDRETGAQLKIEQYTTSSELKSVSYYTEVTYNPPLDKHSFDEPAVPKETQVVPLPLPNALPSLPSPAQSRFTVLTPAYLPPGYQFQSSAVTDFRGRKLVALRYFNGLSTLSVFETPDQTGAERLFAHPRRGVLLGTQAGLKIVLVGNLAPQELDRIMASIH